MIMSVPICNKTALCISYLVSYLVNKILLELCMNLVSYIVNKILLELCMSMMVMGED